MRVSTDSSSIFFSFFAEEGSSHMQSQYGSTHQAAAPSLEYVGVGRRLVAVIIDGLILGIVNGIIGVIFHSGTITNVNGVMSYNSSGPGAALQIIIPIIYYIVMEA